MTDTNVFAQDPSITQASTLESLVGEGKKFKSAEELARAKLESDSFIGQLTGELQELRKELKAKLVQDEILKELGKGNQPPAAPVAPVNGAQALDPEELAKLVRNEIQQTKQHDVAQANIVEADQFITGRFGDKEKAKQFIIDKSRDLGISVAWLMDMAAKSPKALYQVLGLDQPTSEPNKAKMIDLHSQVNNERREVINNGAGLKPGTKPYFDAIRKENKARYFTPEIQNQIFKAKKEGIYV